MLNHLEGALADISWTLAARLHSILSRVLHAISIAEDLSAVAALYNMSESIQLCSVVADVLLTCVIEFLDLSMSATETTPIFNDREAAAQQLCKMHDKQQKQLKT